MYTFYFLPFIHNNKIIKLLSKYGFEILDMKIPVERVSFPLHFVMLWKLFLFAHRAKMAIVEKKTKKTTQ